MVYRSLAKLLALLQILIIIFQRYYIILAKIQVLVFIIVVCIKTVKI